MSKKLLVFPATGEIHRYVVTETDRYIIAASGAQGGAGELGARVRGTFDLKKGDVLHILVGQEKATDRKPHQAEAGSEDSSVSEAWDHRPLPFVGGGDGGSYVWKADRNCPTQLMLAAGNGGSSFNAGKHQINSPRVQSGDGCVSLIAESACLVQSDLGSLAAGTASLRSMIANPESICLFGNLQRALHPGFGQRRSRPGLRPD